MCCWARCEAGSVVSEWEGIFFALFQPEVSGSAGLIKLSSVVENNVIKTTVYINWLKTLMLFRLMILRIYLEGLTMTKNRRN